MPFTLNFPPKVWTARNLEALPYRFQTFGLPDSCSPLALLCCTWFLLPPPLSPYMAQGLVYSGLTRCPCLWLCFPFYLQSTSFSTVPGSSHLLPFLFLLFFRSTPFYESSQGFVLFCFVFSICFSKKPCGEDINNHFL